MYEIVILVLSEIGLSLYPQLIKLVNTTVETQLALRFITYSILAIVISILTDTVVIKYSLLENIAFGTINLLHVFTSYLAFKLLSSGTSYTLFYTYPIFNLIGRSILFNEHFTISQFVYILCALFGVYLVTNQQSKPIDDNDDTARSNKSNTWLPISSLKIGIIAGLLSAITESIIYLGVKKEIGTTPFQELTRFYILGGVFSLAFVIYSYYNTSNDIFSSTYIEDNHTKLSMNLQFDTSLSLESILGIVLFNALVGFIGYVMRFYIIPRITTIKFNSMIFIGIIFAYIWGYLLSSEMIYMENILGSLIIIFTIYMINRKV
jgi:drug/metabolite transporter (DMT)-like permease